MAGLCAPLSTLRCAPHGTPRMTRGQHDSLGLCYTGLSPATPCRFAPAHPRFGSLSLPTHLRAVNQLLQGSRIVDPDLAFSHGQLATRLKLGKSSAHRLEREPKKAADLLSAHSQQHRGRRVAARL